MAASSFHAFPCTDKLMKTGVSGSERDSLDQACPVALLRGCCNDLTSSEEYRVWFLTSLVSLPDLQ